MPGNGGAEIDLERAIHDVDYRRRAIALLKQNEEPRPARVAAEDDDADRERARAGSD